MGLGGTACTLLLLYLTLLCISILCMHAALSTMAGSSTCRFWEEQLCRCSHTSNNNMDTATEQAGPNLLEQFAEILVILGFELWQALQLDRDVKLLTTVLFGYGVAWCPPQWCGRGHQLARRCSNGSITCWRLQGPCIPLQASLHLAPRRCMAGSAPQSHAPTALPELAGAVNEKW